MLTIDHNNDYHDINMQTTQKIMKYDFAVDKYLSSDFHSFFEALKVVKPF